MKQLKDYFSGKKIYNILDVGTGTGGFIPVLKEVFPEAQITGIDPDKESLKEASEKFPDVRFLEMNAERLGFTANLFDLASISMALHHLSNVQGALNEMSRIVKPGGYIIVNELIRDNLNPAQEMHKMFHHFRAKIDRLNGIDHFDTFTKNEILQMLKNAGIRIELSFENNEDNNVVTNSVELAQKVEKMKSHLETIRNLPEYDIFKPEIEHFQNQVWKYGFQPATKVVATGIVKMP